MRTMSAAFAALCAGLLLLMSLSSTTSAQTSWPTTTSVTASNAASLRSTLTREVFGDCGFPTGAAMVTGSGTFNGWPYKVLSSGGRFFDTGANRLLIFHAGHQQEALNSDAGGPLVQYALPLGWDVLVLNMPTGDHSRFANDAHPLTNFMNPVALSLNYILSTHQYQDVVMSGLSGGGWTTVLYAALDERITKSYPVAGSWPKYLRYASGNVNSIGDYEQQLPGLSLNYLDLYALATTNARDQVQVFNSNDPCCFAGDAALGYRDQIQGVATSLGGTFDVIIVQNSAHTVHSSVFDDIAGSAPTPPPVEPGDFITATWKLDDSPGSLILGSAGGYYNGTFFNGPSLGQAPLVGSSGTSAAFNGSSQYATVPDQVNLRPGQKEYAIEMWAKYDSTNYGMAFGKFNLAFPYTGPTVFFNYANDTQTAGRIEFRDKRQSGYWVDTVSTGLNDGVVRYYVFQRRQVSSGVWKLQIYINGVLDAETTLPSVENLNTTEPLYLFSRPGASQYVRGTFDEVQYHVGKSLTPAEILDNYNSQVQ